MYGLGIKKLQELSDELINMDILRATEYRSCILLAAAGAILRTRPYPIKSVDPMKSVENSVEYWSILNQFLILEPAQEYSKLYEGNMFFLGHKNSLLLDETRGYYVHEPRSEEDLRNLGKFLGHPREVTEYFIELLKISGHPRPHRDFLLLEILQQRIEEDPGLKCRPEELLRPYRGTLCNPYAIEPIVPPNEEFAKKSDESLMMLSAVDCLLPKELLKIGITEVLRTPFDESKADFWNKILGSKGMYGKLQKFARELKKSFDVLDFNDIDILK